MKCIFWLFMQLDEAMWVKFWPKIISSSMPNRKTECPCPPLPSHWLECGYGIELSGTIWIRATCLRCWSNNKIETSSYHTHPGLLMSALLGERETSPFFKDILIQSLCYSNSTQPICWLIVSLDDWVHKTTSGLFSSGPLQHPLHNEGHIFTDYIYNYHCCDLGN